MEKSFTLSILLKKSIDTFCASLLFLPESKAKVCYLCITGKRVATYIQIDAPAVTNVTIHHPRHSIHTR